MVPPVLPVPSLLLPPSLEGASVWASDSSTQWLIVVTLICVRLHESVQDDRNGNFHSGALSLSLWRHRDPDSFKLNRAFAPNMPLCFNNFVNIFSTGWGFELLLESGLLFPELGLRWLSRVLTSIYAIVAIGTVTLLPPPVVVISVKNHHYKKVIRGNNFQQA